MPIMLVHRSDRRAKKPQTRPYRAVTVDEVRTWAMLEERSGWQGASPELFYLDQHGLVANIRRNGKIKTWKRDTGRVEIPVKFGMYEAFRINQNDIAAGRLLVADPDEA
jgi:hypothetical protein